MGVPYLVDSLGLPYCVECRGGDSDGRQKCDIVNTDVGCSGDGQSCQSQSQWDGDEEDKDSLESQNR